MNTVINSSQKEFQGIYGKYVITPQDEKEVSLYRFSLLLSAIGFFIGLTQWILLGSSLAWVWLIVMAIGLGGSLKWIHIYISILHKSLQILWIIGLIGIIVLMIYFGPQNFLHILSIKKIYTLAIGPFFAALTGIGFKEFFCFRRSEAIGVTIMVPIALSGHITNVISSNIVILLLFISSIFLLILAIRKFGMAASDDIGDKSVFDYLEIKNSIIS
tara:strand:- start:22613 stop:23260 length:648 start_codon:yes stop_codon:yes gene_type:complete